ncbi:hypothetical protein [Leuconostoc citreum]
MNFNQIKAVDVLARHLFTNKACPIIISCDKKILSVILTEPYDNQGLNRYSRELIDDFHKVMDSTINEMSFGNELSEQDYLNLAIDYVNRPTKIMKISNRHYGDYLLRNITIMPENVQLESILESSFLIWFNEKTNFAPLGLKVKR